MRRAALGLSLLLAACAPSTDELYARYTDHLAASGHMRLDRNPQDAPFTDRDLAQNFLRIALAVEELGDQRAEGKPLRRWEGPIQYRVLSPDPADIAAVDAMMGRLSRLTGLEAEQVERKGNLLILFADSRARHHMARFVDEWEGPFAQGFADALRVGDEISPCLAGLAGDERLVIRAAYVIIKDETSGTLRQACIEEELSQAMGLTNDDPEVRPSIFNDDAEFALLTTHDEFLLRILYHPRLRPGMNEEAVTRLLPGIIAELRGGAAY
ncbi:MAG TPA: DUF2927 domain-containing protein [Paracoccaceae bacterium]|nr:DUF2927 domain-containing protein [Paracoccaceae bacterium]